MPKSEQEYRQLISTCFANQPFIPSIAIRQLTAVVLKNINLWQKIFFETHLITNAQMKFEYPLEDVLQQVNCRVFVLWGDKDLILHPQSCNALRDKSSQIQVKIFNDVGHLPMIEVPKSFAKTVSTMMSSQ